MAEIDFGETPEEVVERLIWEHRFGLMQKQAKLNAEQLGLPSSEIGYVLSVPQSYLTPEQEQLIDRQLPELLTGLERPEPMKVETVLIEPTA